MLERSSEAASRRENKHKEMSPELTPEDMEAQARLLFSHPQLFENDVEIDGYLQDLRVFVPISDGMLLQAASSYKCSRGEIDEEDGGDATETTTSVKQTVKNPYEKSTASKWRQVFAAGRAQSRVNKISKRGRPIGSRNKPCHCAGGGTGSRLFSRTKSKHRGKALLVL